MTLPHRTLSKAACTALLLLACAFRALAAVEDFEPRVHTNATGQTIPYRLHVPRDHGAGTRYPLVLFFHGAGERGTDNVAQLKHSTHEFVKPASREKYPCLVVAPQCPKGLTWVDMPWSGERGARPEEQSLPMRLALGTLNSVVREFNVDTNRIYVTGLSMGGYATWDCVTRFPKRFAAAAPVCGGGDENTITPDVARVPLWAFHAIDDTVVPTLRSRNMVQAMRNAGGKPHYFEYLGCGHASWNNAYAEPELLPWMFSQRLGQADRYVLRTKPPVIPEAAVFPADEAFPGEGPLRKQGWFRKLWCKRRLQWSREKEKDSGSVVFLGDSIIQGWSSLSKDFPNLKVANRGISGDLTRGLLYRLKPDVLDLNPKAIVLLVGTNDLEDGGVPTTIARNIRQLLGALKAHDPNMPVIVCKVMPSHAAKRRPADKIREINALLDEITKAFPQVVPCDTWSIFADAQGNAKKAEFPDLLHPNAAGYAKWAAALKPIFERLELGDSTGR